LFKEKIQFETEIKQEFDNVFLMTGVAEKGRDCVLSKNNIDCGLIQCKKIQKRISKPTILEEIIKFVLYHIKFKNLIPNPNNFTYYFAASTGVSGPAGDLLRNFKTEILKEKDIKKIANSLVKNKEYKSISDLDLDKIEPTLLYFLTIIKVEYISPEDILSWLNDYKKIVEFFFAVKVVIIDDYNDKELIKFYLQCFDRRAFQVNFKHEGKNEFFEAIDETKNAINTGYLYDRIDRSRLRGKAKGKSYLTNVSLKQRMDEIVAILEEILSQKEIAIKNHEIRVSGEFVLVHSSSLTDWFDEKRILLLNTFSKILKEADLPEIIFSAKDY
jgi:hypothetical protein